MRLSELKKLVAQVVAGGTLTVHTVGPSEETSYSSGFVALTGVAAKFYTQNGRGYLEGRATKVGAMGSADEVFQLPEDFRPEVASWFQPPIFDGDTNLAVPDAQVFITDTGEVLVLGAEGVTNIQVSFDGINFRLAS